MSENQINSTEEKIFSRSRVKKYLAIGASFMGIIGIYSLFNRSIQGPMGTNQQSPGNIDGSRPAPPSDGIPPIGSPPNSSDIIGPSQAGNNPMGMGGFNNIWPLWGTINIPTWVQILIAFGIFAIFALLLNHFYKKNIKLIVPTLVAMGIITIIATNFIQGWEKGIFASIGEGSQILTDAVKITNLFDFIANFEQLQITLSVHALTQPPGAIIAIYLFYIIFNDAGIIAIALSVISAIGSSYFLNGIFKHFFDDDIRKYGILLYLILPAVQVYYLANIYAIVAMLSFGVIYFYFAERKLGNLIGSFICLFLLSFTTYLFVWIFLFLGLFELIQAWRSNFFNWHTVKSDPLVNSFKKCTQLFGKVIVFGIGLIILYLGFYLIFGYNYINSFLYASSLENPNGFMLFADPGNYVITRIQDILDIIFFFGPILLLLSWEGIKNMKKEPVLMNSTIVLENSNKDNITTKIRPTNDIYAFVIAAICALIILFLTGAPKKGETARICLFILPFLLIPVLTNISKKNISQKEKIILLIVVFTQTILMQLFTNYIW